MRKKVLIVEKTIEKFRNDLESVGFECSYHPEWSRKRILDNIKHYQGIVFRSKFCLDESMIAAGVNLQFAGRIGSGLENVDLDYAKVKGVNIYRSPEGNCDAVAEHALGMILALFNKFRLGRKMVHDFSWDREMARGERLEGKTIGLIGYGHVGKAFHSRLEAMGVEVLAYDKYADHNSILKELDEIFEHANIVSFHVPLNNETKYFLNQDFIGRMKKKFYLINTSRGEVVNTEDLLDGLESGKVKGACLDVFEDEKISKLSIINKELMQRLLKFEDVILSPHVAGWNQYSKIALHDILFKKIVEHEIVN